MADDFLTVGIGASAGGVQALKRFFDHVPPDSGAAYVVVLHLSPDHESRLAEVLQTSAAIPVSQVRERVQVEQNHVYVVPPNRTLTLHGGFLSASNMTGSESRRAPVDIFFRTLAEAQHGRAVCVILSGTGADGSMGLKRVKEQGGICLAQVPDEAEHDDMPRHAIATDLVDYVLPVAEMPARIIAYAQSAKAVRLPLEAPHTSRSDEQALRDLFSQLRVRTGHDFSNYKRATVLRRLARRMSLHECVDLASYARFFRTHPEEANGLLKDLLISVTSFFRDREAFDRLEQLVIPKLFEGRRDEDHVRVWVAGCATGEEAYSIAMLLAEGAAPVPGSPAVQVFATDIDEAAVALAREGAYSINDAADVSPERLRRFFTKEGGIYRIRPELREMVLFAQHNVIRDPPFSHLDLVSCRNLLIYLNRAVQRRVMEVFNFSLKRHGFLFLGPSESIEGASDLFLSVDKETRLFQSRGVRARITIPLPDLQPRAGAPPVPHRASEQRSGDRLSAGELHQRVLEQYAPPSILVNEDYDIVHMSDRAGRYLQHSGGEPSHNLLHVMRPEIRLEVRTALHQARQQRTSIEAQELTVRIGGSAVTLDVIVRPVLRDGDPARGFFLVLFREVANPQVMPPAATASLSGTDAVRQLEEEVQRSNARLRQSVEQHESQAEELKASNEELQAMNEELRASTEELETSKEELQSLNEEMRTVNQELKVKIDEQAQATDDIQNLMISTEIGTIFLDRESRVKLFTPHAADIFNLIPADRGRPLSDISSSLLDADIVRDIERVLGRLERVEREVKTRDGRWHLMRGLPYRTADDRIDGVVLTFVDITGRKHAEEALRASQERLRLLIDSVPDYAIFTTDEEGRIDTWNSGAARMFGYTEAEAIGQHAEIMFTAEDRQAGVPLQELRKAREAGRAPDDRWHVRKDGSRFYASGAVAPLRSAGRAITGFVKIAHDLTERKRWEEALQSARADLEVRVLERTAELAGVNQALDAELRDRERVEERIRGLLRRLISVQEDERRRIARDLHDQVGQELAALSLKIEALGKLLVRDAGALPGAVDELRQIIAKLDRELDFVAWELRPASLDDFGLAVSLDHFVRAWSRQFGLAADFHSQGLETARLAPEIETNLYRVAQEALNNVHKHAHASRAGVILERRDEQVVLVVEDDGIGFDPGEQAATADHERGLGLMGVRERAAVIGGTVEIESHPGQGTSLFVRVPLRPGAGAEVRAEPT
jgi:two-component system, chemotaxis family, CheB/CheR fusion protein